MYRIVAAWVGRILMGVATHIDAEHKTSGGYKTVRGSK